VDRTAEQHPALLGLNATPHGLVATRGIVTDIGPFVERLALELVTARMSRAAE
jgi:hypothetical protein